MTRWHTFSLEDFQEQGKGIRIAHIDSGINEWHPHIHHVAGGVSFIIHETGQIEVTDDFSDQLGHGTAVAGVLSQLVPEAELWAVKIFQDSLMTHIEVLESAIEWCIEKDINIVNMSLGISKHNPEFEKICRIANEKGIIIVSSCDQRKGLLWPSSYETVFGVETGQGLNSQHISYNEDESVISFRACGVPRHLEGPMQKFNLQGHSFAAAYVTSYLTKLMERYSLRGKDEVKKGLMNLIIESGSKKLTL